MCYFSAQRGTLSYIRNLKLQNHQVYKFYWKRNSTTSERANNKNYFRSQNVNIWILMEFDAYTWLSEQRKMRFCEIEKASESRKQSLVGCSRTFSRHLEKYISKTMISIRNQLSFNKSITPNFWSVLLLTARLFAASSMFCDSTFRSANVRKWMENLQPPHTEMKAY